MRKNILLTALFYLLILPNALRAEDGYRLWLRYEQLSDSVLRQAYRQVVRGWLLEGDDPTLDIARKELEQGLSGLLGTAVPRVTRADQEHLLLLGTPHRSPLIASLPVAATLEGMSDEGYIITTASVDGKVHLVVTAHSDTGILYGVFHFLRLLQTHQDLREVSVRSEPKTTLRVLNHWDNLDRTVERGYAGFSLWDWHKLPDYIDQRYHDYARANASVGINGTVLTNVNANALILTPEYLAKVAALADVFRPYGITVYLTARFSAPIETSGLPTADPLDPRVQQWWQDKVKEIYTYVPDFGGFLVKANSEGQPGPQNYGRSHADGANMLAKALEPYQGVVMWRAFVYDDAVPDDRAKQAYQEFKPLDGEFHPKVLVQVKNGAIDFQPREPFHPLFGAMPQTPLMMEFQITQEYLGHSTHLVYLAPLFKEVLMSDTYAKGEGSLVADVVDGSLHQYRLTGMAGVSNIGTDRNWTGHHFGQSNWYAYGRLAWDHALTSEEIAEEWIRMTFSNEEALVEPVKEMMLNSHEAVVNYMTPLGLHHIMGWSHHYGPGPWIKDKHRDDWTSVYYHQADTFGIGFDRTATGSNAVAQYFPPVEKKFGTLALCPEKYLLWFHHVGWDHQLKSGQTLWNALCHHYDRGVATVEKMQQTWDSLKPWVDDERFAHVQAFLSIQQQEARWWRDACLLYFQTFSRRPIPEGLDKPSQTLDYYMSLDPKFVPGN